MYPEVDGLEELIAEQGISAALAWLYDFGDDHGISRQFTVGVEEMEIRLRVYPSFFLNSGQEQRAAMTRLSTLIDLLNARLRSAKANPDAGMLLEMDDRAFAAFIKARRG